jgi:hypothetical protein
MINFSFEKPMFRCYFLVLQERAAVARPTTKILSFPTFAPVGNDGRIALLPFRLPEHRFQEVSVDLLGTVLGY